MKISLSRIIWGSIWLLLLFLPLFPSNGKEAYFIIVAWAICIFVSYINNGIVIKMDTKQKRIALAPIVMVAVWAFGLLVGIVNRNPTSAVLSNFAGTILYLFFYILLCYYKKDLDQLKQTIIYVSIIETIAILGIYILINVSGSFHRFWPISNVDLRYMEGKSTNGIFIGGQSIVIALVALSEWNILNRVNSAKNNRLVNLILFVLSSYATVSTNTQGGLRLAYLGTVALVFLSWIMRKIKGNKNRAKIKGNKNRAKTYLIIITLGIIIMVLLYLTNSTMGGVFDPEDGGNRIRLDQIRIVSNNFAVLGHGLGNMIYEPLRGSTGYGIEMTYANLVDKYGVFSVLQICIYFITLVEGIIGLARYGDETYAIAIGLMGYLFIAAGNPVLFAPSNVICHCLALFLIYKTNSNRRYAIILNFRV